MKNENRCPKCAGKRIWVIEKFRIPGDSAEGRVLPIVPHQSGGAGFLTSLKTSSQGHVDLHVCDGCGYTELWSSGIRGLKEDPVRGIRLVDTSDTRDGPFR